MYNYIEDQLPHERKIFNGKSPNPNPNPINQIVYITIPNLLKNKIEESKQKENQHYPKIYTIHNICI